MWYWYSGVGWNPSSIFAVLSFSVWTENALEVNIYKFVLRCLL